MVPCTAGQPPVLLVLLFLLPPAGSTSTGLFLGRTEAAIQRLGKRREAPLYPPTAAGESSTDRLIGTSQTFSHPHLGTAQADSEIGEASLRAGEGMLHSPGVAEPLSRTEGGKTEGPSSTALRRDHAHPRGGITQYPTSEIERTTFVTSWNVRPGSGHHLSQRMDPSVQASTQVSVTPQEKSTGHPYDAPEARRREGLTYVLSEPGRQESLTHTPAQPGRRVAHTHIPLEAEMTEAQTQISSLSVRREAQTHILPERGRLEAKNNISPQPRRRGVYPHFPSEPEAQTYIPYESGSQETHTDIASGRHKTQTSIPSEFTRADTQTRIPSQLERAVPETHILSEPTITETGMAKVLVSSKSRRSEALEPSQSWRPEGGQTETHIPSDLANTEAQTLPEPGRAGGGSQGRLIHARSPRNKIADYHTFQKQNASAVQTRGTETPPEPGGTRSASEWKRVRVLNRSERMVIDTRAAGATRSSPGQDVLGQGTARPAVTFSEESRDPDLPESPDTRGGTSSEPGIRTFVTLPEPKGERTREPPQPDGLNDGTTSGAWEAKPHSALEPGGAATLTPRGPESGQTATETDRKSAWTSAQASRGSWPSRMSETFPSGSESDWTESKGSLKTWTSPLGALERDWTGVVDWKGDEPISVSEPGEPCLWLHL
ncbi:hypothetical protein NDU88_001076 [Pleurodeles waltl]|uniref:Uncharacterized protein n=1 Tax=Pleurodeles waltl TaxID=8319 RepID=A0AAV7THM2_PLEWA|nr:hypothetical protein NDU88_001076 [Pleurodeles waltl]